MGLELPGGKASDDHLANAVVISLYLFPGLDLARSNEVADPQDLDHVLTRVRFRGFIDNDETHGTACDRYDLEEPSRPIGKVGEAGTNHAIERDRGRRGAVRGRHDPIPVAAHGTGQLGEKKRIARGLAGDRVGESFGFPRADQEGPREVPRLRGVERFDSYFLPLLRPEPLGQQMAQDRARSSLLASVGDDQKQRRGLRGAHEFLEQRRAVHVSPVQIVDEEDERSLFREPRQELPKSAERAPAKLVDVPDLEHAAPRARHGLHPPQHGKKPRQRENVAGHQRLDAGMGKPFEVMGERVHQAVERLVRNGLPLEAPPRENHGARVTRADPVEKTPHERALAHSRLPVESDCQGLPLLHLAERFQKAGELDPAPDKERFAPAGRSGRCEVRVRGVASEPLEDLGSLRAPSGVPPQQLAAQAIEVLGDPRDELARRPGLPDLLFPQDIGGRAREGTPAGQGLVEHHAEAVPVTRLRGRFTGTLLR